MLYLVSQSALVIALTALVFLVAGWILNNYILENNGISLEFLKQLTESKSESVDTTNTSVVVETMNRINEIDRLRHETERVEAKLITDTAKINDKINNVNEKVETNTESVGRIESSLEATLNSIELLSKLSHNTNKNLRDLEGTVAMIDLPEATDTTDLQNQIDELKVQVNREDQTAANLNVIDSKVSDLGFELKKRTTIVGRETLRQKDLINELSARLTETEEVLEMMVETIVADTTVTPVTETETTVEETVVEPTAEVTETTVEPVEVVESVVAAETETTPTQETVIIKDVQREVRAIEPDDLKLIFGIGPSIAEKLEEEFDITTFAQVAAIEEDRELEAQIIEVCYPRGRKNLNSWIADAKELHDEKYNVKVETERTIEKHTAVEGEDLNLPESYEDIPMTSITSTDTSTETVLQ